MSADTASPTYLFAVGLQLPVTSTFALPLSAYYLFLEARVIKQRLAAKSSLGQTTPSTSSAKSADPLAKPQPDLLQAACRAQGNFSENVPLAMILAGLVELNGGHKKVLTTVLAALLVGRIAHVEFGLMDVKNNSASWGRAFGFFTTAGTILGLAVYGAYLTKGYWGL